MNILLILFYLFPINTTEVPLTSNITWTERTKLPVASTVYFNKNRSLNWNDFRGTPVLEGRAAAITVSGFGYNADVLRTETEGVINIQIYCFFDQDKSWVKKEHKNEYVLNHEQLHFNISYIAAIEFVNKLRNTNFTDKNYKTLLPQLYAEGLKYMEKLQAEYDNETRNGLDKETQSKWDDRLRIALDKAEFSF